MSIKKFLIISAVFPPEPVVSAKLSYDLAIEVSNNQEVMVISPIPTRPYGFKFEEVNVKNPFEHYQLQSYTCPESKLFGRLKETYSFGLATYDFISKNHRQISHIYSNTWPLFAQLAAIRAAKKYNLPITIHVQDIYPESLANKLPVGRWVLNSLLLPIDKYIFKHASHVIAISEKMRQYLSKSRNISLEKISVVANWQDEAAFSNFDAVPQVAEPEFTFMYLGNIGPVAGIDLLIESFAYAQVENCRLVIAGSGAMRDALQKQALLHPNKNIQFWPVPDGKVVETQSMADVMLLPMKKGAASSSIPSKLPAYMFSKKPVIACVDANSDTAQAIRESECGWVLEPENENMLARCMEAAANLSKASLVKKGELGYQYSIQNFSKKSNLRKLINFIANSIE